MDYFQGALELHKKYKGKITTSLRDTPNNRDKLSMYYSPGVAEVSKAIAQQPTLLREYTWTNNLVAVISDGSAVLGLGNIGPKAAMPVMEGKSMLLKHFADIDSVPIVLNVHSPDEIIAAIAAIAPSFGAINLEDIAAPTCFEVEDRLKGMLDIPVFHDDQHGTAIVTLAGLINATKLVHKKLQNCRIVLIGAGAAGVATAKLLHTYAQPEIIAIDTKGVITAHRSDLSVQKQLLASFHARNARVTSLQDALNGADIVIGISKADMLQASDIKRMAKDPIVFALANPTPEIMPHAAKAAGAAVVATGRSDFANQVNNALAFPGIFRGALDNNVQKITDNHKIAVAEAIAALVKMPSADEIIPSVMNKALVPAVAHVIR